MKILNTLQLSKKQKKEVLKIWNTEYPSNLCYDNLDEFDKYLSGLYEQNHILIVDNHNQIKGWYFDFIREQEKWFAIILDSSIKGKGIGTKIMTLAKEKESELNGWVIDHNNDKKQNGEPYISPLNFYLKNDFRVLKDRLELDIISAAKIKWTK